MVKQFLTQPEATWGQGALVPRAGVLIGRDRHELQHPLSSSPIDALMPEVHQNQMVVGPTWNTRHFYKNIWTGPNPVDDKPHACSLYAHI